VCSESQVFQIVTGNHSHNTQHYSRHHNFSHFIQADTHYTLTTAQRTQPGQGLDLLVADLAHFEQAAAGADVALLDLVGAVHDRRACHRKDTPRGYNRHPM
jgi:hypothetical protein